MSDVKKELPKVKVTIKGDGQKVGGKPVKDGQQIEVTDGQKKLMEKRGLIK